MMWKGGDNNASVIWWEYLHQDHFLVLVTNVFSGSHTGSPLSASLRALGWEARNQHFILTLAGDPDGTNHWKTRRTQDCSCVGRVKADAGGLTGWTVVQRLGQKGRAVSTSGPDPQVWMTTRDECNVHLEQWEAPASQVPTILASHWE